MQQHQIVAVDHLVTAAPAEDRLDLGRAVAGDALGVRAGIGAEAASEGGAVLAQDLDRVAAVEGAVHAAHAGGQQRAAGTQGARGAGIDDEAALGGERAEDPALAGAVALGGGQEPGAARAGRGDLLSGVLSASTSGEAAARVTGGTRRITLAQEA